uniref:Replication factor A C-terminal domain-containing protein n=1 Tax=Solanum lycopersicum TaxID=4081 RepID=A0A3Q7FGA2_SOLLC
MTKRLNINEIDENTEEWICKVQVVDKGHPRTTREGNNKYQLMILQDEKETQMQVIMHGTDVGHYANEFVPFQTYLLLGAFVSESIKTYGIPLHQFRWTIDKGTIVEPIDKVIPPEPPLLPPTLLKTTSFDSFDYQAIGFEFGTSQNIFTNSSSSYDQMEYPSIREGIINFRSDEIKPVLNTYTTKSTAATGSLLFVPFEEHIVPIVNIQQQSLGQVFHMQALLLISNETQKFRVLVCSDYKQVFPRIWTQRKFYCTTCRRPKKLTPRCQFQVTIKDDTGSTTAMISNKIGEELLSLTVAEIHDIRCIKKQLLSLLSVQHKLLGKTFTIQIKKLFAKNKDASSAKLVIMSITEIYITSNLPLPINAPTTPESSKRKLKQIMIKED